MEIKEFIGDGLLECKGVKVPFEDATFTIASVNSPAYKKALKKARKQNERAFRKEDDEALTPILVEAMAEHILLGWEGCNMNGKPFPYSKENAIALLNIPTFRDFVANEAGKISNFVSEKEGQAQADLKSGGDMAP